MHAGRVRSPLRQPRPAFASLWRGRPATRLSAEALAKAEQHLQQRPGRRARPRDERNRHRRDEEIAGRRLQTPLAAAYQDGCCGEGDGGKTVGRRKNEAGVGYNMHCDGCFAGHHIGWIPGFTECESPLNGNEQPAGNCGSLLQFLRGVPTRCRPCFRYRKT